jgi:hypothetical protein
MAAFNGKFQYSGNGTEGDCRVEFDAEKFTLSPDSAPPLVFDLGDLEAVIAADYEIKLSLYTGNTLVLRQFGKPYETLTHDLLEAYRKRTLQCLLLEDMEEVQRFTGSFELALRRESPRSGPAEIRLFKSNLAVLPNASQAFQWRLADVDSIRFDSAAYEVNLQSGDDRLKIARLAKRTEEFVTRTKDAISQLASASMQALHAALPFLNPEQLQNANTIMREGRSASLAKLAAISPKIPGALAANAVDADLKPYYDQLVSRTAAGLQYAGFKLIRAEEDDAAESQSADEDADIGNAPDADQAGPQTLYWFFFPFAAKPGSSEPANLVAWEASSRSGRATYFFHLVDPQDAAQLRDSALVDAAIQRLNRALGVLNFRRRPIYVSDDVLEGNPQFHRYAIAARRIPEVRELRKKFIGRAIHSSLEAWQDQVASIVGGANAS